MGLRGYNIMGCIIYIYTHSIYCNQLDMLFLFVQECGIYPSTLHFRQKSLDYGVVTQKS